MENETKKCPFCGEEIMAVAKKCKHCKQFLPETDSTSVDNINNNNEHSVNNLSELKLDNKKLGIIAVVVVGIIVIIYNSSNSLTAGCTLESSGARSLSSYGVEYSCNNNKYYNRVTLSSRYDAQYPNYYVGDNRMERTNGEYVCSIYAMPDKIHNCNEAMFKKLIIKNDKKAKEVRELNEARLRLSSDSSKLHCALEEAINDRIQTKIIAERNHEKVEPVSPIESLAKRMSAEHIGNQLKLEDGVIISLSDDFKNATFYDNVESPKYFINERMKLNMKYRFASIESEYTDKQIPADNYIKNAKSLRRFTEEEMKADKLYK